mmetsp:Transcript_2426/g.7324  ORF Transcript_2426/g.7324 Transcript_2426/m.7324 type:complete len:223 (-) Transcript_2426:134-802(-)
MIGSQLHAAPFTRQPELLPGLLLPRLGELPPFAVSPRAGLGKLWVLGSQWAARAAVRRTIAAHLTGRAVADAKHRAVDALVRRAIIAPQRGVRRDVHGLARAAVVHAEDALVPHEPALRVVREHHAFARALEAHELVPRHEVNAAHGARRDGLRYRLLVVALLRKNARATVRVLHQKRLRRDARAERAADARRLVHERHALRLRDRVAVLVDIYQLVRGDHA